MYAPQLVFLLSQFSRANVLILSMEAFKSSETNSYMQSVLDFANIPAVALGFHDSVHANAAAKSGLVQATKLPQCTTRSALGELYAPWNQVLYALEPEFPEFPSYEEVPCV
mmetsp:Transcript_23309/g.71403  ORF Transcript_23309/g.71403 Transcript_23309/m.71403 type:complete len:111 (+) Transcript_23309:66-398(+)